MPGKKPLHIPITPQKTAEFHFIFQSDSDNSKRGINTSQKGNILTFTLTNFLTASGASLSKPFEFNIGVDKFFLQLYGASSGDEVLCLTLSIFRGKKND